jgi:hypothetical protein
MRRVKILQKKSKGPTKVRKILTNVLKILKRLLKLYTVIFFTSSLLKPYYDPRDVIHRKIKKKGTFRSLERPMSSWLGWGRGWGWIKLSCV